MEEDRSLPSVKYFPNRRAFAYCVSVLRMSVFHISLWCLHT